MIFAVGEVLSVTITELAPIQFMAMLYYLIS